MNDNYYIMIYNKYIRMLLFRDWIAGTRSTFTDSTESFITEGAD